MRTQSGLTYETFGGGGYPRRSFHAYPLDTQIRTSRRMSPDETALFAAEDEL